MDAKVRRNPHLSTEGKSPSRAVCGSGILISVDNDLKAHVLALIARAGTNPTRAARDAGLNPHFIRQWLSGRVRSPGTQQLQAVADVLGVTLDELTAPIARTPRSPGLRDDAPAPYARAPIKITAPAPKRPPLVVRHIVQAGAWLEQDADAPQTARFGPPVTADPRIVGEQWLELVEGDSIDKIAPPGSFLHVVGVSARGYIPRDGDVVVVERVRDQGGFRERSVKVVKMTRNRIELWPSSNNQYWSKPLKLTPDGYSEDSEIEVSIVGRVLGVYFTMGGNR
jgi:repressor LexA